MLEAPTPLTTAEVQARAGLSRKALRLYEARGLIRPRHDPHNGYRVWGLEELEQLRAIATLRLLGLSLREIERALRQDGSALLATLAGQRRAIQARREQLQRVERALERLERSAPDTDANALLHTLETIMTLNTSVQWFLDADADDLRRSSADPAWGEEDAIAACWTALLERAHSLQQGHDSAGSDALCDDWLTLLRRFLGPKEAAFRGLLDLYAHMDQLPEDKQLFDPALGRFMAPRLLARFEVTRPDQR